MQQRGSSTAMEDEDVDQPTPPPSRGRHNSKLKVLVRSHAMREETSPPREPTPNHLLSPCIKLTPSPEISSGCTSPCPNNHMVVISPAISRGSSPCRSNICISPTSTLVSSPNSRCSPQCASSQQVTESETTYSDVETSCCPKYLNKLNKQNLEKDSKQSSHNSKKKLMCDCQNQNCIKCIKSQERNINNNLTNINNNVIGSPNTLSVTRVNSRGKLRQQSSSQGSFESSSNSPCLSRDSSSEQYTDTTGIDLELFIPETLNRNAKDRALMLRIEQELVNLAKDRIKSHYKFPPMSSYQRMLVHRCAAYFGMDHNIESSGKCVVVNKTKNTRIPDVEFKEHVKEDIIFSEEPRRSILKRDSNSIEDYNFKSPDRSYSMENRRSKSFEEREEEYEKARKRIFNREMHHDSSEDFGWAEMPWSSTDSDYVPTRLRLPQSEPHRRHMGKLIKVQSEETGETLRPCVAKSYSFGGYGGVSVLSRGDSVMSTHSAGPRLLTKQDSAASSVSWRLSPSSSGYKSQSQMSESVTPSPTSTPHPICGDNRQDSNGSDSQEGGNDSHMVWAVTDIHNVPKGSIIINPETGKPIKNNDGSLYHYDPCNPPPSFVQSNAKPSHSPHKCIPLERTSSPKKYSTKMMSPIRKLNLTNSSTSPILPYSPPMSAEQNRNFHFISSGGPSENIGNIAQQEFPVFTSSYQGPAPESNIQVYQSSPYIVYSAPFSVPLPQQFDGRIVSDQTQMPEMAGTFYVPENAGHPPAQQIAYQPQSPYWNQQQQIAFYPNNTHQGPNPSPQQRFPVAIQSQGQAGFVPTGYPPSYMPQAGHPPQNPELMPVYPNQTMQMIYSTPPNVPNSVIYQNQPPPPPPLIYTQNPVFPNPYQPQTIPHQNLPPYPHNNPTPNNCAPQPMAGGVYGGPIHEQQNLMSLSQSMQQMSLGVNQSHLTNFMCSRGGVPFDQRPKGVVPKAKFSSPSKGFVMGSSQSSTGTNSPAATVIAGYCPQTPTGVYRTPPETPPNQFAYPPNYIGPQMIFRQMSNVRASTPVTARSSRSPTPAGDLTHFERQRMSLPPNLYQGMPYVLHSDTRLIPGRGQPTAYRQSAPGKQQQFSQGSDHRYSSNKGRKSNKGNKPSGLPPSGKPV